MRPPHPLQELSAGRSPDPPWERSIVDTLRAHASAQPERVIFRFLQDGEELSSSLTYGSLDARARDIAATLGQQLSPGDRAVLLFPPGLEFVTALFGCFYARVIAVPAYPPRLELGLDGTRPLVNLARDCEPAAVLSLGSDLSAYRTACAGEPEFAATNWIDCAAIPAGSGAQLGDPALRSSEHAMLQYTSGSTGDPKGVLLSHGNIIANQHVIQLAGGHSLNRTGGVTWLPSYHDLGLFGGVLQSLFVDGPCTMMPPLAFLQRPLRWLQAISDYGAHTSGGPNFAYELCVQRINDEQLADLDLSSWKVAAIGAERVSAVTIERFTEKFAACGFAASSFAPGFGLAEATLVLTSADARRPPLVRIFQPTELGRNVRLLTKDEVAAGVTGQTLVGCGQAAPGHAAIIVDPETRLPCPEGVVGEIWGAGPSIAEGYWNRPEATAAVFHAQLADGGSPTEYLRTGDLGFYQDGHLFVSGRLKELIVVRGRKHAPEDLEATIGALHEAFRPNSGAAIGVVIDDEERLVILQEIDRQTRRLDPQSLVAEIRRRVAELHQLHVHEVHFLRNASLPRTTSGKVRRGEARRRYLTGELTFWQGKTQHDG